MKKFVKFKKLTALILTTAMLCSSVGTNEFISNAQGNMSEQEVYIDDMVSGNTISGNTVSGNELTEETISGNTVSDNDPIEESVSGNTVSNNNPIEDVESENTVSGNEPLEEAVPGNTVSDNNPVEGTVSGNTVSCNEPDEKVIVDNNMDGSLSKKPTRPVIDSIEKNNVKTPVPSTKKTVTIKAESGCTIYYSINGKNPTYKNGIPSANANKYDSVKKLILDEKKSKVVVKAISVNKAGLCSPVTTQTYLFKPAVSEVTLSAPGSVTSNSKVSVKLVKGKSLQLKANFTPEYAPDKKIIWETTGLEKGVRVSSSGKVTTKKTTPVGDYTVTATLKSNSKVKATITVNVKDAASIDKIKVSKKNVNLISTNKPAAVSEDLYKLMEVTPVNNATIKADSFVWSSSDKNIATVNSKGVVSSVTNVKGKATITAVAKDGSGKTAKFTVNVSQMATKVTITGNTKVGIGKSQQLKATVAPEKVAGSKVKWEITSVPSGADASAVKISSNGKFTATKNAKAGSYTVKATAQDGSAKYGTFTMSVLNSMKSIDIDPEKKAGKQITLYRTKGSDAIAAVVTKSLKVEAFTTDDKASANFEVVSSLPGVVSATYNSKNKAITIKTTGNGTGTATITCRAVDGSGKKDTIKVKVINPPSSIDIQLPKESTGDLASGYTHKPDAVIGTKYGNPGNVKVTWKLTNAPTGVTINEKTGALKIPKTKVDGTDKILGKSFKISATVEGDLKLAKSVSVTIRNSICDFTLGAIDENGDLVTLDNKLLVIYKNQAEKDIRLFVKQKGKEKDGYKIISDDIMLTTKKILFNINSDELTVSYDSKNGKITFNSKELGEYLMTVKALDGTGKSKTYKIRVSEKSKSS